MIKERMLYSLGDITVIPTEITEIESRSECNPMRPRLDNPNLEALPVITAPMSCVLNETRYEEFLNAGLNCIIPRTVDFETRLGLMTRVFCAFSKRESEDILKMECPEDNVFHILIDNANGHMKSHIELGRKLKDKFGDKVKLMGGNIANPKTYRYYEQAGFDYVRVGIGGGRCCITSTQTSIHYPMASLISDMVDGIHSREHKCKIIADGGIATYSDIIKCLALGADYVMCGRALSKAALEGEAVGDMKEYYGMSTRRAQIEMGATKTKTSEGRHEDLVKEYTLQGWCENLHDYIRSAMSYCNSCTLDEFRENAVCQVFSAHSSSLVNGK